MKKIIFLLTLFVLIPNLVLADGMFIPPDGKYAYENGQSAVIFYENNVETLIISTKFQTDAIDFAWIVPTPSQPTVEKSTSELFNSLEEFTQLYKDNVYRGGIIDLGGYDYQAETAVQVIETKKISYYDITVLKATESEAFNQWLNENGYTFPTASNYVLEDYINNNWYFTAVKISGDYFSETLNQASRSGDLIPLSLQFTTDKIVFPLKISSVDIYYEEFGLNFYSQRYKPIYDYLKTKNVQDSYFPKTWKEDVFEIQRLVSVFYSYIQNDLNQKKPYAESVASVASFVTEVEYNDALTNPGHIDTYVPEVMQDLPSLSGLQKSNYRPRNNPGMNILFYIIADKFYDYSDFSNLYLGAITKEEITKLASNDQGDPWLEPTQERYALTKLSKYLRQSEMTNDVYFKESTIKFGEGQDKNQTPVYILIAVAGLFSLLIVGLTIFLNKKDNKTINN